MGATFIRKPALPTATSVSTVSATTADTFTSLPKLEKRRGGGGVKPKPPLIDLNQPGRLKIANLLALYNIASANTLYQRLHAGKIPPPDGRDGRSPYWLTSTIRVHLEGAPDCN
ncbi:hypothetical protein [Burkholderia arboris]|uniref:hypothetical protein n=1 Tax=Burkholderia arboris TaxID=488730 RepID=UPI001CF40EC4|nr:hypothetical protein [Burkholderia arboris]MCA8493577.1 hypothetical protein [Burkholderia arboris]